MERTEMKIANVSVQTTTGCVTLSPQGSRCWSAENITLKMENQRIFLTANGQELLYVYVRWPVQFSPAARVLGDVWERGYGTLSWKPIEESPFCPWYALVQEQDVLYGFGVKTGANALCAFTVQPTQVTLCLDVRNGSDGLDLQDRTLELAKMVAVQEQETPYLFAKKFCGMLCDAPLLVTEPIYGGNDWYTAYGRNSDALILEHAKLISDLDKGEAYRPFMVIDDGWQVQHGKPQGYNGGPWHTTNEKFKDMSALTAKIREMGVRPGIWFRPLYAQAPVEDEMVLRQDGLGVMLDPSHDRVLERVRKDVQTLTGWGFELIKHDFSTFDILGCWGFEDGFLKQPVHFYRKDLTTAQVIKNLYTTIREAAGDALLIGCNTMGHLSAGLVEIQRGGDDTSGRIWETTRKMGVNTLAFRGVQDKAFFHMDADCVGVTRAIPWEKNRQWLMAVAHSGTPLFLSCEPEAITPEVFRDLQQAFRITCRTQLQQGAEPIDWMDTCTPQQWQRNDETRTYTW